MSAVANEAGEPPAVAPETSEAPAPDISTTVTTEKPAEPVTVAGPEDSKPKEQIPAESKEPTELVAPPPTGSSSSPTWPSFEDDHPLSKLLAKLPELLSTSGHDEVYGVKLKAKTDSGELDFHTLLILQKFLRANQNDLDKAVDQLLKTLEWRKEFNPITAMNETFSKDKFAGLGYVTESTLQDKSTKQIVTWNIYGAVKDYEKTFVPLDDFIRWRIALMEFGVSKLELTKATKAIPDYGAGPDPYQGIQVHDYQSVSFLRMDPRAKAASKKTIELLGAHYPETLSRKFFVNVPLIMQWMFGAMKLFVSKETTQKFAVLSYGSYVAVELSDKTVPKEYGGDGGTLSDIGQGLKVA